MTKDRLNQLMNAFYAGETTLEEEEFLADFLLNNPNITANEADRKLFELFRPTQGFEYPTDFDSKMDKWVDEELLVASNPNNPRPNLTKKQPKTNKRLFIRFITAVAASIMLLFTFYQELDNLNEPTSNTYISYSKELTPEEAIEITQKALNVASASFYQCVYTVSEVSAKQSK